MNNCYFVRNDLALTFPNVSQINKRKYELEFVKVYKDCVIVPDAEIIVNAPHPQFTKLVTKRIMNNYELVINLDKLWSGDILTFNVSRVFINFHGIMEFNSIQHNINLEQIEYNGGKILVIDDDVCSGRTQQFVNKLIKQQLNNDNIVIDWYGYANEDCLGYNMLDCNDMRDFIPGALNGGLVVDNNYKIHRICYLDPLINLTTQSSIKESRCDDFRKAVVELNRTLLNVEI